MLVQTTKGKRSDDISPSDLEAGLGETPATPRRWVLDVREETRRFCLLIAAGVLAILFAYAVRRCGDYDTVETVGILQVSVVFFVKFVELFPWV